ncbi:hypothetical protein EYC80_000440 [Monilinia laxa]|uniref:Uncharacterized protein n=1 Tax=Monilinia laxa TaxID=61186 RepID=A0A5N6KAM5_MONLA|nr:hypothetical protein EYC80_000440 [Monilinia laxa]
MSLLSYYSRYATAQLCMYQSIYAALYPFPYRVYLHTFVIINHSSRFIRKSSFIFSILSPSPPSPPSPPPPKLSLARVQAIPKSAK